MVDFYIKQNDTRPVFQAALKKGDGSAINLTGATVEFHMRRGPSDVISASAEIYDASTGVIRYEWQAGDTSICGDFPAEAEITYPDASVETVPNESNWTVRVTPELD